MAASSSSQPSSQASSPEVDVRQLEVPSEVSSGARTYKLVGRLGSGASASVFEALYKNERVALKVIPSTPKFSGFLKTELLALEKISAHPYIISLNYYGLDAKRSLWFLDLEFCEGGDALHRIQQGPLTEAHTKLVSFRLFQAIAFAHSAGICHRDIKLENVLFRDKECSIPILADWGMSATFNCYEPLKRDCGSLHYAAPEILSNQPYFGDQVDSFSTGVLIFAFASGCFPFTGKTPRARLLDIIGRDRLPFPRHLSPQFRDVCCGLVETDPRNRLTIVRALTHAWFDDPAIHLESSGGVSSGEPVSDDIPSSSASSSSDHPSSSLTSSTGTPEKKKKTGSRLKAMKQALFSSGKKR